MVAKPKSKAPDYNKLTWLEPAIQSKTCTWAAVNFITQVTLMSSKHEPMIWSHDARQQIPCFDRCQLNITLVPNIKDKPANNSRSSDNCPVNLRF